MDYVKSSDWTKGERQRATDLVFKSKIDLIKEIITLERELDLHIAQLSRTNEGLENLSRRLVDATGTE